MYPYDNDEFDEEERAQNAEIKRRIPFAVVGSEKSIIVGGKQVRGRQNRWGVINGEYLFEKQSLYHEMISLYHGRAYPKIKESFDLTIFRN